MNKLEDDKTTKENIIGFSFELVEVSKVCKI